VRIWRVVSKETPFGVRWDVQTPYHWTSPNGNHGEAWLVQGLVGDDDHKTEFSAREHARLRYGPVFQVFQKTPNEVPINRDRKRKPKASR
jgi:hypothetical protein